MGNLNLILVGRGRFQTGTCLHFLAPKLSFFNLCGIFKQHGGYQTTFDHFHDKPVKLFFSTVDEFVFFTQLYFTRAYLTTSVHYIFRCYSKKQIKEEKVNEEDAVIKKKTKICMGGRRKR